MALFRYHMIFWFSIINPVYRIKSTLLLQVPITATNFMKDKDFHAYFWLLDIFRGSPFTINWQKEWEWNLEKDNHGVYVWVVPLSVVMAKKKYRQSTSIW